MIDVERAWPIVDRLLARASGTGADLQVTLISEDGNLTRFAGSEIHQNISQKDLCVILRAARGGALAQVSVHGTNPDAHDRALDRAVALLAKARPIPGFDGLAEGGPLEPHSFVAPGAERMTLEHKAAAVQSAHRIAAEAGALSWGVFVTGRTTIAIGSTRGVRSSLEASDATFETLCAQGEASGYASTSGLDPLRLDVEGTARRAAAKVERRGAIDSLPPGEYEVVLEPHAVAELLEQFAYYGATGSIHADRMSFLLGREGERVFSELVTIRDDGTDASRVLPLPFDLEGLPRAAATLIDRGTFRGATHDRISVSRASAPPCALSRSTAGLLAFFGSPPMPLHLALEPGSSSRAELVRGIQRGVYVTRLWYVRMQDRVEGVSTGLTRDGTFLIENGEIAGPLRSARYTQGLGEMLSRVTAVSSEGLLHVPTAWFEPRVRFGTWAPALRISGMRFTS